MRGSQREREIVGVESGGRKRRLGGDPGLHLLHSSPFGVPDAPYLSHRTACCSATGLPRLRCGLKDPKANLFAPAALLQPSDGKLGKACKSKGRHVSLKEAVCYLRGAHV